MECRYCGEFIAGDPDKVGARCPRCREPMYEKTDPRRQPEEAGGNGKACAVHPKNAAASNCQRCGAAVCPVCRTRWRDEVVCPGCLEKVMEVRHVRPEEYYAHRRQALLGLALGGAAWVVTLATALPLLALRGADSEQGLLVAVGVVALTSLLPSLCGAGQAAAAVRARGDWLRAATCGLLLSASHAGVVLGLVLFAVWNR
jgi:hypothetical protein